MEKRPIPVTVLGCLLVAAGLLGLAYHLSELRFRQPIQYGILGIALVRLLAVIAGAFMLRGQNWARWLGIAWIAFHVIVSFYHSWPEVALHAVLLLLFAYFLFRPQATRYFHREPAAGDPIPRRQ